MVINTAEEAAASIFTIKVTGNQNVGSLYRNSGQMKREHDRSYRREQRITLKKITRNTDPEQTISEDSTTVSLP
jgi:hypothetical protein